MKNIRKKLQGEVIRTFVIIKVEHYGPMNLVSAHNTCKSALTEMMDNTFNFESPIATITDSGIKVFPNSDDIEKIIENPANWVVVPLLFKECDD